MVLSLNYLRVMGRDRPVNRQVEYTWVNSSKDCGKQLREGRKVKKDLIER